MTVSRVATLGLALALLLPIVTRAGPLQSQATPELIAFMRYPARGGISVVPSAGGKRTDLTIRHGAPWYFSQGEPPVWSPDGKWIAFVDSRQVPKSHKCLTDDDYECPAEIYVIRPDGTGERRVTNPALGVSGPEWSPDGRMLVFKRDGWLRLINSNGSGERRLTTLQRAHYEGSPSWAPAGRSVAFVLNDEVYISDLRGHERRVSNLTGRKVGPIRTLVWSPDGRWIAFSAYGPYFKGLEQIFVVEPNGRSQRRLTRAHPDPYEMAWSPDSSRIAFGASGDSVEGGLFTVTVPAGSVRRLQPARELVNWEDPSWSSSGAKLVVGRSTSGNPHGCWVMNADGSGARQIVREGHSCTWQPRAR